MEVADTLENGWQYWLPFSEGGEAEMLRADQGNYMGFVRLIANRKGESK